jgi:ABC-type multidrug transport system fused ATPase/permease subunit
MNQSTLTGPADGQLSLKGALQAIVRVVALMRFFKARVAAVIGMITLEHFYRMLLLPWALKIIVDHVILGQPIDDTASEFPGYLTRLVLPLRGMHPADIMFWMLMVGIGSVILFGMTPNRATGRNASGTLSGASAGSQGIASATLAEGQDTATQSENAANSGGDAGGAGSSVYGAQAPMAGSVMGGLLGILDFKIHMRLTQSINHMLRTRLAEHILCLPVTTLDDQRIGDSTYRVMYDSTSVTGIYEAIVVGIYPGLLAVTLTLGIMLTSFGAAPDVIVAGILVGPLTFLFVTPFARLARRRSEASRFAGSKTTSNIEEGMSNVLAVQSLGGNKQESKRFNNASSESFKRFRSEVLVKLGIRVIGGLAFITGQIIFFLLMSGYVIDGTFTAGDYFVMFYYYFVLSAVFYAFGYMYTEIQGFVAGMGRVFRLLDLPAEKMQSGVDLPEIKNGVSMQDVGLCYPDGRRALRNISFEASVGEIVALVGPTGAGKTTLAYLVPALLQATEGEVSIDGIDLKDVSVQSLRKQVSYVFQETQLFSDSIFDNIRYGNKTATLDEVKAVARTAGAHDFITTLPEGYDTNLGTVTSKLSVGQKQRISIARGLLRESRILILDEPTSALDPETEEYLVNALHEAATEKLVIVIAHRLSTISHADKIYFLEAGEILESGSHEELMSMPQGRYRQYVDLQAGES